MATTEESSSPLSVTDTADTPVVTADTPAVTADTPAVTAAAKAEKPVMLVGIDESEHSFYALEWTIDRFLAPFGSDPPFKLIVVHVKPHASPVIALAGAAAVDVLPIVEKIVTRVIEQAKQLCNDKGVHEVALEVIEGDAGENLCEAVEKHDASMLVVGSHGYGAIKRAFLGSVSDYCAHHAHCTVMIVKKPKIKQ